MQLNLIQVERTVEAAKTRVANPPWLRTIDLAITQMRQPVNAINEIDQYEAPEFCPACHAPFGEGYGVEQESGYFEMFCSNRCANESEKANAILVRVCSKPAMKIDGWDV